MGCGASNLRGDDVPSINAKDHERDLQSLQPSQQRVASGLSNVDQPSIPPKTTLPHDHQHPSENEVERSSTGWKDKVKKAGKEVMMPTEQPGIGKNTGVTEEEALARGYPSRGPNGVVVPDGQRHHSHVGLVEALSGKSR